MCNVVHSRPCRKLSFPKSTAVWAARLQQDQPETAWCDRVRRQVVVTGLPAGQESQAKEYRHKNKSRLQQQLDLPKIGRSVTNCGTQPRPFTKIQ
jgi:hypothetical protein